MARSFVARGAASRARPASRPDRPDRRAARGRARRRRDRAALRERPRAARLGDALRADDRRERQPRHRARCSASTAGRRTTSPCRWRSWSATSSQTGFYRQKAKSIRGAMRVLLEEFDGEVPRTIPELLRLPGVARKTANVVAAELGRRAGDRRRHARPAALAAARPDAPGGSGARSSATSCGRPARRLGAVPAPADLARATRLRRAQAALRGLRARRPLPGVA